MSFASDDRKRRRSNLKSFAAMMLFIATIGLGSGYGQSARENIYLDGRMIAVEHSVCIYSLSPTNNNVNAGGGSGSVGVTCGNGACPWTATNNNTWITVTSGSSGTGNGTVGYSVAANTGPARNGTITIGGQTFTVSQANGCTYSISPTSNNIGAGGGSGSVGVTCGNGACPWTATSNNAWITVTSGGSGTGNGTVGYSVAANTGPARNGTITIGGQTFTVSQVNGCTYSISPTNAYLPFASTNGTVNVTASNSACSWTASTTDDWITVTDGSSGTGNGTVSYSVAVNQGSSGRVGTISIAGQTFTIYQYESFCGDGICNPYGGELCDQCSDCGSCSYDPVCMYYCMQYTGGNYPYCISVCSY
jgi:hypothetical protein